MPRERQRRNRDADPFSVEGSGLDPELKPGGDIDFDADLPDAATRGTPAPRKERGEDKPGRRRKARAAAGHRYREEINFDEGLPQRHAVEKRNEEPPPTAPEDGGGETVSEEQRIAEVCELIKQEKTEVQTLIFSKDSFDTAAKAKKWARDNGFKDTKVDETDQSFRIRQKPPGAFKEDSFRTIKMTDGVKAVIGRPKKAEKTDKRDGLSVEEFRQDCGSVPPVLQWEAVRKGWLPKDDGGNLVSGLAPSLEPDVPPRYRYWKCASEEEALRVREALVEARLFTPETVRKVAGSLRRVIAEPVVKLYLPPDYNDEEPPVVPPVQRPVEKAAALLQEADAETTLFDEKVVEALGIDTVMERAQALEGDWIVAAKDSAAVRKAMGGPAFRLPQREDLIFVSSADLADPDGVEWVTGTRADELIKHAFREGREIPILKSNEEGEERIVFGVVMEPEEVDSQGDTVSADEIEKAAHRFMEDFGNLGHQHQEIINGKVVLLETFIAPVPFEVDGEQVKKGSWLFKERVRDDELWGKVKKGEITGFSIGGSALRRPAP